MYPIHAYGSDDQKERWLPDMGKGEAIGGFALTEPDHGSDAGGMETHAERDGDEYVLDGEKRWCTNSPIADVVIVWARNSSDEDEPVRGFLVETNREGLGIDTIEGKLSLRASSPASSR